MNVNDVIEERIAAARRRIEAQRRLRARLKRARTHGLRARHAAKLARQGQAAAAGGPVSPQARFCASCARSLGRGTYRLCGLGCGARLCRRGRCLPDHTPNCPTRQAASGIDEASNGLDARSNR